MRMNIKERLNEHKIELLIFNEVEMDLVLSV